MGYWFSNVDTVEGAREATQMGLFGALAVAAMTILGLVFLLATGTLPGASGDTLDLFIALVVQLAIILIGAWRFWRGFGLVWGILILVMFGLDVANKIAAKTTNVGWCIAYLAVAILLVNGIRGAWAMRKFRVTDREKIKMLEREIGELRHGNEALRAAIDLNQFGHAAREPNALSDAALRPKN